MNAADQLVSSLAAEGVEYIFGIPGEENLHFMQALQKDGRIKFILCRHEQAAGFMAAAYGRLTGKLAVAMSTLGAGAMNLTTAVAHAYLSGMPMLVLTGQKALRDNKMGLYQLLDVVEVMRPITKYSATVPSGAMLGAKLRQAMMTALSGRFGPVHLELPDDVMLDKELGAMVPCMHGDQPIPSEASIHRAAQLINEAKSPLIYVGGGTRANRPEVAKALRQLIEEKQIPFVATMMGKGVANERGPRYVGTSIIPGDYTHCAVTAADVILNVGHDIQEKPSFLMNPNLDKTVIHLNPYPAQGAPSYFPQHQVVGDMATALNKINELVVHNPQWEHKVMYQAGKAMQRSIHKANSIDSFPAHPGYIISCLRAFMGNEDIMSLDNGVHMMWATRNFGAYEPNTMLVDHALGSMGISLPAAIAAKLVYPERTVVVVTGDGGFMMNSQDLETAVRLGLDLIVCIFNDAELGMIGVKQKAMQYAHYGVNFNNPDMTKFAAGFGAFGHRLDDPAQFTDLLNEAQAKGGVHIIDIPIDKKQNMNLLKEMRMVDCNSLASE